MSKSAEDETMNVTLNFEGDVVTIKREGRQDLTITARTINASYWNLNQFHMLTKAITQEQADEMIAWAEKTDPRN